MFLEALILPSHLISSGSPVFAIGIIFLIFISSKDFDFEWVMNSRLHQKIFTESKTREIQTKASYP